MNDYKQRLAHYNDTEHSRKMYDTMVALAPDSVIFVDFHEFDKTYNECQGYWRSIARLMLLSWYIPLLVLVLVALWLSVLPGVMAGAIMGGLLIVAVNNVEEVLGDE